MSDVLRQLRTTELACRQRVAEAAEQARAAATRAEAAAAAQDAAEQQRNGLDRGQKQIKTQETKTQGAGNSGPK